MSLAATCTITSLQKHYNGNTILSMPSLELLPGIYLLRAPNGAGKSTFMRIMAGIVPASGDIQIGNISLNSQPIPYRKQLAYSEAEPVYPPYVTGWELLQFVCKARNFPLLKAQELCEYIGVSSFYQQPTEGYSSGMRKKLSLVLTLANTCSWVLLDEPFNALDIASQALVKDWIQTRYQQHGSSFIISAHQQINIGEANGLGLENGRLVHQQTSYAHIPG